LLGSALAIPAHKSARFSKGARIRGSAPRFVLGEKAEAVANEIFDLLPLCNVGSRRRLELPAKPNCSAPTLRADLIG
jgi:hypothetical protein